jgi:hypothetical protein
VPSHLTAVGRTAVAAVALLGCAVSPAMAGAVIPVADEQAIESHAAARLPAVPPLVLAGDWTGQAPDGSSVRVSLRVDRGVISGAAEFGRALRGTSASGPLVRPRMTSASGVAFTLQHGACDRDHAEGAMTLLSPSTAELVVSRSDGARVLIRLVRAPAHRG